MRSIKTIDSKIGWALAVVMFAVMTVWRGAALAEAPDDFKDRLPRVAPKEPAESLKTFSIIPGFRIEPVAVEPLVCDPVDLAFDADGRLYVVEMIGYSERDREKLGRVRLLEDTDGDGRFDKSTVFADGLSWNAAIACYDGGVFVGAAPDVLYFKDTDGDGRADFREVVITGFARENINAFVNTLRWRLDNRIHGVVSTAGGSLRAVKWESGAEGRKAEPLRAKGRDFSFDPRTGELRLESGGRQHGLGLDAWGRKFVAANSEHCDMVMYEDRYIARNPLLAAPAAAVNIAAEGPKAAVFRTSPNEPWRIVRTELRVAGKVQGPIEGGGTVSGYFTAACGVAVYTGDAWPAAYRGNFFVCEGAGNLVHRKRLEPSGVGLKAHRTEQGREFLNSTEIWFRPVQLVNAPDGNLYVADMYREIFEHPDSIPPQIKKHLDLNSGCDRGRIYRIVPETFRQGPPVRLSGMSTAALVHLLAHANGWHRRTAARLLYERQDRRAIGPLVHLAAESPSPLGRMHAIYALDGLDALSEEVILPRLADEHPRVREHAVRLAEKVLAGSPAVRAKLCGMVADPDPRVRYQLAFTLGEISTPQATDALARIAARDASDRWVRLAVLSSAYGRAGELFSKLAEDRKWRLTQAGRELLGQIAYQVGLQNRADQVAEVLGVLDRFDDEEKTLAESVVGGLSRGLAKAGNSLAAQVKSGEKERAHRLLTEMLRRAKLRADDPHRGLAERVEAIRLLALAPAGEAVGVLGDLLDSRQPQDVQTAALAALGRHRNPAVARMVVRAWGGFSPAVQNEAAEVLMARRERLLVLLAAIRDRRIKPAQLDPARLRFLLSHRDPEIRAKATEVLGNVKLARRADVVAAYRDVLTMKGDAVRGKAVFKKQCAKCHRLEGVGYELGLPLNTVKNRGAEAILLNMLDPNREVNPQYKNYIVTTEDGLSASGLIAAETATSITLRRAEGKSDTVLRVRIEDLYDTGQSLMPEGLEEQLSKQDMADLIAYLLSVE